MKPNSPINMQVYLNETTYKSSENFNTNGVLSYNDVKKHHKPLESNGKAIQRNCLKKRIKDIIPPSNAAYLIGLNLVSRDSWCKKGIYPTQKQLSKETRFSEKTIGRAYFLLEKLGFGKVIRRNKFPRVKGAHCSNIFIPNYDCITEGQKLQLNTPIENSKISIPPIPESMGISHESTIGHNVPQYIVSKDTSINTKRINTKKKIFHKKKERKVEEAVTKEQKKDLIEAWAERAPIEQKKLYKMLEDKIDPHQLPFLKRDLTLLMKDKLEETGEAPKDKYGRVTIYSITSYALNAIPKAGAKMMQMLRLGKSYKWYEEMRKQEKKYATEIITTRKAETEFIQNETVRTLTQVLTPKCVSPEKTHDDFLQEIYQSTLQKRNNIPRMPTDEEINEILKGI